MSASVSLCNHGSVPQPGGQATAEGRAIIDGQETALAALACRTPVCRKGGPGLANEVFA